MNKTSWMTTLLSVALMTGNVALVACDEAAQVAHEELGPRALLKKYMLLKEMHAQLEKKQADIKVYKVGLTSLAQQYAGVPRNKWAHEDLDAYNQKTQEVAGTIASYNDLAAQYNAKMSEANWAFCNVGSLPKGADEPLPREYAQYKSE